MSLKSIESINVKQTILGRILNYGSISINGCKFTGDEENKKFNKINNKKVEALFVSFVSDEGVQEDLSTTNLRFCDIK